MNVAEIDLITLRSKLTSAMTSLDQSCSGLLSPISPDSDPFAAIKDCVVVCDRSGKIIRATNAAAILSDSLRRGRYVSEFTQKDVLATDGGEFDVVDVFGSRAYFRYTVSKVSDMFQVVFFDVTDHHVEEEQLRATTKIYAVLADQSVQLLTRETADDELTVRQLLTNIVHASFADGCVLFQNNHQTRDIKVRPFVGVDASYIGSLGLTELFPDAPADLSRRRNHICAAKSAPTANAVFGYRAQTFLLIPVYVNGYWWGELVFLYSRNYAASWYHTECDALRTTAALISSILSRVAQLKARANAYLFQQALFDVVPLPLYAKTLDGSFYYANDEFCRLVGLSRDEIFLLKDSDVFNKHSAGASDLEVDFVSRSGEKCAGLLTETQLKTSTGTVHGVLGVYQPRDSCSNSCMHRSVDLLQSLLNNSGQYVLYKDKNGIVIYANSAFTQIAGSVEGATNTALAQVLSDNFMRELFDAELKSAHTGREESFQADFAGSRVDFVLKPIRNAKTELLGYLLTGSPANEHGIQLDALRLPAITVRGGVVAHCNELAKNLGLRAGVEVTDVPGYLRVDNADGSVIFAPLVKS